LRRWSHHEQYDKSIFSRGPGPRGSNGFGSRGGTPVTLGGHIVDRGQIGCTAQTLNEWVKKAEVDSGVRAGIPTEVAEKLSNHPVWAAADA
jgi:hypothetical protein